MSIGMRSEEMEREIEIGIVRAFGWAVIEFEAVLFQKFLVMSASSSLMTEDMFRKYLKDMEAKGYLAPVDFQRKRAWKRLVIESDIDEEVLTPEEVKEFIERAKISEERQKLEKRPKGEQIVSESKALAERIIRILEKSIPRQPFINRKIGQPTMINHIEAMRHALAESREDFLRYVRENLPQTYRDMERFIDSKGEEVVLLSLRIIESGNQAYPP
ncbi:hypothetical protein EU527_12090 [Candidatus Thorarchaeota archaeon]|nr:MAG: hypothetical protein EU527_12090 [Candidatus Thorarchaeota archaeon]